MNSEPLIKHGQALVRRPAIWRLGLLVLLLLLMRAQAVHAAGLKNLGVLQLERLWLGQSAEVFDPPCQGYGNWADLEQSIRTSIATGDTRGWTHLGRVLWLEGRCAEAVAAWEQAGTGRDPAAAFELVRVGEYAALSPSMRQMIAEQAYHRGIALAKAQGDQVAAPWFRRSFDLMPHHNSAQALAEIYRKAGDTAAILRLWQRMTELVPRTQAEYWWAVAEMDGLKDQWESAALAYTNGAGLTNDPYDFWMEAGSAWAKARQSDYAIAVYERAYQEHPDFAWTCLVVGNVYQGRGQYSDALRWYFEAKAKTPNDIEPYYRLGETYYLMGDYAQAGQYLDEALKVDPNHAFSIYYVAKILYGEGNHSVAQTWLLDAITRIPWRDTQAAWWMELGDWRLEQRNCSDARAAYASARDAGAQEQTIQQKLKTLSLACGAQ